MSTTVFTNGPTFHGRRRDNGRFFLEVEFGEETPSNDAYARIELEEGAHVITNGAIGLSFGRGGSILEVISLEELQARAGDEEKIKSEATGSCTMTYDEHGLITCASVSCSGSCSLKSFLFWTWCSCG